MVLHSSRTFLVSKFYCDTPRNWSRFFSGVVKILRCFDVGFKIFSRLLITCQYLLVIKCIFCIVICSPHGKTRFYSRTFEQLVQPQILLLGKNNGRCSIPGEDYERLLVTFLSGLEIQSLSRVTC